MKTNYLYYAFSLMLLLLMISCSKQDEIVQKELSNLKNSNLVYGIDIELPQNDQDLYELLLNPEDNEDEKINFYLYYLSLSIEDLVQNSDFNRVSSSKWQKKVQMQQQILLP